MENTYSVMHHYAEVVQDFIYCQKHLIMSNSDFSVKSLCAACDINLKPGFVSCFPTFTLHDVHGPYFSDATRSDLVTISR